MAHYGGIQWMLEKIKGFTKSKRSAQVGISALVSLCDIATANNTIAIIIAGQPSKEICETYEVDPRKSASLLDIWVMCIPGNASVQCAGSYCVRSHRRACKSYTAVTSSLVSIFVGVIYNNIILHTVCRRRY